MIGQRGTVPTPRKTSYSTNRATKPGTLSVEPNPWTIVVGPRAGFGSRMGPQTFAIKFKPPMAKNRGLGRVEFIIGSDVSLRAGFQADEIDSAILRISADLTRGRLEPTTKKTLGSIRVWGIRTIRVRCSGGGFPPAVIQGIAYAALPRLGKTIPTLILPTFEIDTNRGIGAIEFDFPKAKAFPLPEPPVGKPLDVELGPKTVTTDNPPRESRAAEIAARIARP